jgi:hypothetical protein
MSETIVGVVQESGFTDRPKHALTCTVTAGPACFGTHSAHAEGMALPSSLGYEAQDMRLRCLARFLIYGLPLAAMRPVVACGCTHLSRLSPVPP